MKLIDTIEKIENPIEPENDDEEMETSSNEEQQELEVEVLNEEGQWEELSSKQEEENETFRVDEVVYYDELESDGVDTKMDGGIRFEVQHPDEGEDKTQVNDDNQENNDNQGGNSFEDEYQSQIEIPTKK